MKKIITYLLLLFCGAGIAHASKEDSLWDVLKKMKVHDQKYVSIINEYCMDLQDEGNYERTLALLNQAIRISDSLHFESGLAAAQNILGNTYRDMGDTKRALENHLKALVLREKMNDTIGMANSYINTGNVFIDLQKFDEGLEYYKKALAIYEKLKNKTGKQGAAVCLGNIGLMYNNDQNYEEAEKFYKRSILLQNELKDTIAIADCYTNMSMMFMDEGIYDKALENSQKALAILPRNGRSLSATSILSNLGDIYQHMGNNDKCIEYEFQAIDMARSIRSNRVLSESYRLAYVAYKAKHGSVKALEYFDKYITIKDSILNEDNLKNTNELQAKFETDRKVQEISLLQKNKNIDELSLEKQAASANRQQFWLTGISGGIILAIVAGLYLLFGFINKARTNKLLLEKNVAIYEQKMIIEQKNETITLGFNYAKTIQDKIIPDKNTMQENIGEHFVLFRPKDIVSGDFYWTKKMKAKDAHSFLAAVDCTGHGVPGALMSLHAYDVLEKISKEKKLDGPAQLLDELNAAIKNAASENESAAGSTSLTTGSEKFGMDMSVIAIDRKKMELQFAGARNSVIIIRADGSLIEVKADRVTIGSATEKFTDHTVLLQKDDMIYLFSDGYADQIGGPQRKKYLTGNFKNLLLSIADKNMEEQQNILAETHHDWMGNFTQTDDVMVVGIRI